MKRLVKKLIGWTLCLMMAVGMLPVAAREAKAADTDAGAGEGIAWNAEKNRYDISNYEGLLEFARIVNGTPAQFQNDSAANAKIVVEVIDASASNPQNPEYDATLAWTPIGDSSSPYTGTFDGNGCTIKWLTIDSADNFIGLFGYVGKDETNTGSVQNVTLEGGSIKGSNAVGGVVGWNEGGTVSNCYNTGDVEGNSDVGGVVGYNGGTVSNCNNTGDVTGSGNNVGGVVGRNYGSGTVSNCNNTGDVSGSGSVGGVVGYNDGTVSNCYNTGDVSGSGSFGGVVGYNDGTVSNCYNTGDVSGSGNNVGGVTGWNNYGTVSNCYNTGKVEGKNNSVGGVAGYNEKGTVSNCYNTGAVSGRDYYVGGVVGENDGKVSNCYNTGTVNGRYYVGGVAGWNKGTVSNCYNTGDVTGSSYVGGVAGRNHDNGTVSNCYYNKSICQTGAIYGFDDGDNAKGLSTTQMTGENAETFMKALLDAKDGEGNPVWIVRENSLDTYYYPHLKGFAYDTTKNVKDWSATISSGYTYELDSDAFDYDGKVHKPTVTVKKNGDEVEGAPYSFTYEESVNAGEYTIRFENTQTRATGVIPYTIKKRKLEIIARNQTFTYNGQTQGPGGTIYVEKKEIKEFFYIGGDGLTDTHSISSIILEGQGNEAKTYEKELIPSNAKIVNTGGDEVTTNYEIEYISGDLIIIISPIPVTLTANSGTTVTYDGTEKTVTGYTCSVEGLTFDGVTAGVSATKAGTYEVTFVGVKVNETKDFTGCYTVTKTENGTLTINKRPLTITADSDTKVYDGTALTKDSVSAEGLAAGDKIESITVTGSQTVAGKSDNTPSEAKIVNSSGEDVTKCYEITYENGTLEVTKKALTITVDSASKEYDKTALTKDSYTVSGLADGDSIKSVTISGSQIMKGSSENVPSKAVIVNAKGEDVTSSYDITYKNGTLTVTAPDAPSLDDDQKPAPKQDLKEDGKDQILVLDPANLPEGYTIEYSTDGGKTWTPVPTGSQSGEYTIEVLYKADENHTDFFGDPLSVIIQGVYNQTESDGDWTKGSGKTYTFRIKKAFNDEVTYDNLTGVFVDGKKAESGKDYTPAKGSAIITFASDYLETLAVGEHMIRVVFKDGEVTVPLKILAAIATPTPAVDATPTTGDTSMPILWATLILLSMAGAAVVVEKKRRRA